MTRWSLALAVGFGVGCTGCHRPQPARPAPLDCRPIAVHGQPLIDASPAAQREDATRLIVSLIDLCQSPGLAASTRTCVLAATTIELIRACPAMTEVLGDATAEDGAPSCRLAVDHAMDLLAGSTTRPQTRDARRAARAAYLDGCAELNPAGRRCVAGSATIAQVDDCFADPTLTLSSGAP